MEQSPVNNQYYPLCNILIFLANKTLYLIIRLPNSPEYLSCKTHSRIFYPGHSSSWTVFCSSSGRVINTKRTWNMNIHAIETRDVSIKSSIQFDNVINNKFSFNKVIHCFRITTRWCHRETIECWLRVLYCNKLYSNFINVISFDYRVISGSDKAFILFYWLEIRCIFMDVIIFLMLQGTCDKCEKSFVRDLIVQMWVW